MILRAEDITIAVTVYNRRDYVLAAIRSAVNQTIPVKVMVVEDCGPDATLCDFIVGESGNRIEYIRNSRIRGLFGYWNVCREHG
jgi:glycosyltransferase involved in cell wall biosynthesis